MKSLLAVLTITDEEGNVLREVEREITDEQDGLLIDRFMETD